MSTAGFWAPSAANQFQQPMIGLNRQYPIAGENIPIWMQHQARILGYQLYWRFYKGIQWEYQTQPAEGNLVINYCQKFVDKHNTYLFGNGFTIHSNFQGSSYQLSEDLLNQNWEKNALALTAFEMGQLGGVTGDCWVNVGLEEDPIFGLRVKYTCIPSEFCFPIFRHNTSRVYDALLIQWPDVEVIYNNYGRVRNKSVLRGWYWTQDSFVELVNGEPITAPQKNYLNEIPFVHIPNIMTAGEFWGRSDINAIVDPQRDLNAKMTDMSDIINYHAAPTTIIYGAKASALQKGAKKVWSNLPKDARVENLTLDSDLGGSKQYIDLLREALFQLGDMSSTAFGGAEAISNTSGVALALQFAPLIEHMKMRRMTYEAGIQRINYLTLKFYELLGYFRANGRPTPYYSGVKWSSPLPRDAQNEMTVLLQMQQLQLLSRVQILRQLIHEEVAPTEYDVTDADKLVQEAMDEEIKWQERQMASQNEGQLDLMQGQAEIQQAFTPPQPPTPEGGAGGGGEPPSTGNSVSGAEKKSRVSESQAKKKAGL